MTRRLLTIIATAPGEYLSLIGHGQNVGGPAGDLNQFVAQQSLHYLRLHKAEKHTHRGTHRSQVRSEALFSLSLSAVRPFPGTFSVFLVKFCDMLSSPCAIHNLFEDDWTENVELTGCC